jgi:hypothetical protein
MSHLKKSRGLLGSAAIILACSPATDGAQVLDGSHQDLIASSRRLYEQYEAALSARQRERLASFYHPDGAVFVINGRHMVMTIQEIDSVYTRSRWNPPDYFMFDELVFNPLSSDDVAVTGTFLWQRSGTLDTTRYRYAAFITAIDSGMAIRFEHETVLPRGPHE